MADTQVGGSLDCDSKLMPCPSCASICHQVMRLCPYLSPDRMQYDLGGKSLPQVSQYGGHPAFYCPLENDDPSDPAYTSLCYKPFVEEDPDHVHNICTNPPKSQSFPPPRRDKRSDYYDGFTSPSPFYNFGPEGEDYTGGSPEFAHYTTCCWTYASSLVIFDPAKDYPNYGSDAFFSTTLTFSEYGPQNHLEGSRKFDKVLQGNSSSKSAPTKSFKYNNVSLTLGKSESKRISSSSKIKGKNTTGSATPRPSTFSPKSFFTSTQTILPGDEINRVILNCCNSQGDCNAVDGEEEGGESVSSGPPQIQEVKSELYPIKIKNKKRSSERLGQDADEERDHLLEEEEEDDEAKLDGSGSLEVIKDGLSPSGSSSSSSSSATVLSLPSLFFKTIDHHPVANPTHISELEDLDYDEHYLDTEPESSAASSREDLEESEEDEGPLEKVGDEKVNTSSSSSTPSSRISTSTGASESVHYQSKSRSRRNKEPLLSIVMSESDGRSDDHVDRDHHSVRGKVVSESRTKAVVRDDDHEELEDDESFTFIDTANSAPGDNPQPQLSARTFQEETYYARDNVPSSASSSFLWPKIGLLRRLLSPTYLISCVFMIRMWCLNSFVAVSLLLLVTTFPSSALVVTGSTTFVWICGSFLYKSNFRRTRTRDGSKSRYCAHHHHHQGPSRPEKVTDDGSERVFCFVRKLSHLFLSVAQPLPKLAQLSLYRGKCRHKLNACGLFGDDYNYGYKSSLHCYKWYWYSAWGQSFRVSCTAINSLPLATSSTLTTQIQQQDFYRNRKITSSHGSQWDRYQDKRRRKEDNNSSFSNSSRSLLFSANSRKRRRKSDGGISCRNFKEIKILRDFLPTSPSSSSVLLANCKCNCPLCLLWLGSGGVVFNFKLNKFTFIANANLQLELDAPSKSLKSLLNLNLLNHASMLACLLIGRKFKFKYKLKLLNCHTLYNRISSNYVKIISTRWKRKRRNFCPSVNKATPTSRRWSQHQLTPEWVGLTVNRGHISFSQCCRTDKLLSLKILVEMILKISMTHRLLTPTSITIIRIQRFTVKVKYCWQDYNSRQFPSQTELQVKTLLNSLCCQKCKIFNLPKNTFFFKLKFCPILSKWEVNNFLWVDSDPVQISYSNDTDSVPDLHLLSLLLSLAKRAARKAELFVGGQVLQSKLPSVLFFMFYLGLRGQSKSLIELCNEPSNESSFKVYARETLKLVGSGGKESTIKIVFNKKSWKERCSSHKTAAGFEIHPLIML